MVQDVFIKKPFGPITTAEGRLELNPDLLNPRPNAEKIKSMARHIFESQHPSVDAMHWLIAERRWLYVTIKNMKKEDAKGPVIIPNSAHGGPAHAIKESKMAGEMRAAFKKSINRMRDLFAKDSRRVA